MRSYAGGSRLSVMPANAGIQMGGMGEGVPLMVSLSNQVSGEWATHRRSAYALLTRLRA